MTIVINNGTPFEETLHTYFQYISDQTREDIMSINHGYLQPLVNLCGTIGNIINIVVFLKMGFSETINISLLWLSVADLGVVLTLQWLNLCQNPLFKAADVPLELNGMGYVTAAWPHVCFARAGGMITAYIALERCICVVFPLKVKKILTRKVTTVVVVLIYVISIITITPYFTVVSLEWMFFPHLNRSLIGMKTYEYTAAVENTVLLLYNVYSYVAVLVVLICSSLLIKTIMTKAKWRETASQAGQGKAMSGKDRQIVVMVILLSIIFCIGYIPITIVFIVLMALSGFSPSGTLKNVYDCMFAFAGLLESLNCSVNICTYLFMSTKYRKTFFSLFEMK